MLETLDYTIRIGSIPTFLYFDLYLYSAYAAHFGITATDKSVCVAEALQIFYMGSNTCNASLQRRIN